MVISKTITHKPPLMYFLLTISQYINFFKKDIFNMLSKNRRYKHLALPLQLDTILPCPRMSLWKVDLDFKNDDKE